MVVVYCLIGNSSGILPSVATEGFGYNTFLGIWNMTLRNGDRLGVERGGKEVHRKVEGRVFHKDRLSSQQLGQ